MARLIREHHHKPLSRPVSSFQGCRTIWVGSTEGHRRGYGSAFNTWSCIDTWSCINTWSAGASDLGAGSWAVVVLFRFRTFYICAQLVCMIGVCSRL